MTVHHIDLHLPTQRTRAPSGSGAAASAMAAASAATWRARCPGPTCRAPCCAWMSGPAPATPTATSSPTRCAAAAEPRTAVLACFARPATALKLSNALQNRSESGDTSALCRGWTSASWGAATQACLCGPCAITDCRCVAATKCLTAPLRKHPAAYECTVCASWCFSSQLLRRHTQCDRDCDTTHECCCCAVQAGGDLQGGGPHR